MRRATRWRNGQGFSRRVDLFPEHHADCQGHRFRAVSLDYPPFLDYIRRGKNEPVQQLDSVDVRIIDTIAAQLNFTYAIYEPVDCQWGYQQANGSWTGVIGTVGRYEADFSLNVLITGQREEVVDFTVGYHREPLTFAMGKPKPLPQWLSLVRPYTPVIWAAVILTVLGAVFVQWVLMVTSDKVGLSDAVFQDYQAGERSEFAAYRQRTRALATSKKRSALVATGLVVRGILRQDMNMPRRPAEQIFLGVWLIVSFVLTIIYVSYLTAFLTVPTLSPTVKDLDELSRSHFSWGLQDLGAADYQLFKSSEVPLYKRIFQSLKVCSTMKSCLQQTIDENFAFISWLTYLRDAIAVDFTDRNGDAKVILARDSFAPAELGFSLTRNSRLKAHMDVVMRRLMEGGLVQKWLSEFIQMHAQLGKQKALQADLALVG
ncbi:Ionotropic receptor 129, partial [Hyalella azteca]